MLTSQFIPPSPFLPISTSPFSTPKSLSLPFRKETINGMEINSTACQLERGKKMEKN